MSSQSNPPARLSPSVIALAVTLLLVAVAALLGISLLTGAWNNSSPVQTGAMPIQQLTTPTLDIVTTLPETVVPAVLDTVEPTLNYVLSFPPEVTPFPTFDPSFVPTIAPITEWVTHTDDLEGFSIRYPQGWFFDELPLEIRQTAGSYTTHIGNYKGDDPALIDLYNNFPPQLFKIDLGIEKPGTTGVPIPSGQSLEEWAHQYRGSGGDTKWVEEGYVTIAGTQGYRIVWQNSSGQRGVAIWVPRDERIFGFTYFLSPIYPELVETAEQIIASIQFTR